MANEELKKAVEELEALTTEKEEKVAEPSILTRLVKSMESMTAMFKKSQETKKPEQEAKKDDDTPLAKSKEEKEEVIDVGQLLDDFTTKVEGSVAEMAKGVGVVSTTIAGLVEKVEELGSGLLVVMKSQAILHKSLESSPKSTPTLGVVLTKNSGRGKEEDETKKNTLGKSKGLILINIEKAVQNGDLEPRVLELFSTRPNDALGLIPERIQKSYDIPSAIQ